MRLRRIHFIAILFFIVIAVVFMFKSEFLQNKSANHPPIEEEMDDTSVKPSNEVLNEEPIVVKVKEQGSISIVNIDANSEMPIPNTEYKIMDYHSANVIEVVKTDETGIGTSSLLDYGISYQIKQTKIMVPYALDDQDFTVVLNESNHQIISKNEILEFVKEIQHTEDGLIEIAKLHMPVETLLQWPELPNGCEITSLTAVLNYYGYGVSKTEMADDYLSKQLFVRDEDNKLYGANPYLAFSGDPRDERGAFFVYGAPIVFAAEQYINDVNGEHRAYDMSGSTREEIIEQLNLGIPVVIWVTLDLSEPRINYSWYFHDTEEHFDAPVNLHAVVLNGYEDNKVHVMDPLQGQVIHEAKPFFDSYEALGSHAMIVF